MGPVRAILLAALAAAGARGLAGAGAHGLVADGANGALAAGAQGLVADGAHGLVAAGAQGLAGAGGNGLVVAGHPGLVAAGAPFAEPARPLAAAWTAGPGQEGAADLAALVPELDARAVRRALDLSPLPEPPLDPTNRLDGDPRAEALGRFLFFDERLSRDGTISCATCHDPARAFSDGRPVAVGLAEGTRRTPSLLNAAHQRWFFHDGRADTLWSQALGPLETDHEMGSDRVAIARRVFEDPALRAALEDLRGPLPDLADRDRFPEHARPDPERPDAPHARAWRAMAEEDREAVDRLFSDLGKCLAAYERRLVTRDAPLDTFVEGLREADPEKLAALDAPARRGLALFVGEGRCRLCHNGPLLSDGEFHGLGLAARGGGMPEDPGRYEGVPRVLANPFNAAGRFSDDPGGERARQLVGLVARPSSWGEFRTPGLRDVALRAPYMHGGQLDDLEAVVHFYSTLEGSAPLHQHQEQVLRPLELDAAARADLLAFLESLTGRPPGPEWTTPPAGPGRWASPDAGPGEGESGGESGDGAGAPAPEPDRTGKDRSGAARPPIPGETARGETAKGCPAP